ncbi:ACT domain-containing protein [Marinobacteraceae bacterium S3BR75-40.1]
MMSYAIDCRMDPEPAALERLCQVVRIRGFRIEQLAAQREGEALSIHLEVSGERSLGMLITQLEKLHTVYAVTADDGAENRHRHAG